MKPQKVYSNIQHAPDDFLREAYRDRAILRLDKVPLQPTEIVNKKQITAELIRRAMTIKGQNL